ncbi:hypothetical protein HCG46_04915 [Labrenzia sp. PO1]|uniref:hypothetical protein n=1 Tax=Labrenzia sp. PO1 TaxID=2720390 RepID=UPI0014459889|nr:hypothetical protein [Labrenzia sp. PO1]NKI57586.1 hypothetical protein [Labrenzia sp. PO1]
MKKVLIKSMAMLWTHRIVYLALAGAYAALCLGADKDLVNQLVTAFYAVLAIQHGR